MKINRLAFDLFLTFGKIGTFTFGGGYAMIPLIENEMVENKQWITHEDILEILAIAESTPGPIAVNAATFVGYRVAGTFGAFCATMGVVLPSFLIIYGLSFVIRQFQELKAVQYAFFGIRAAVLALICKALISMYKHCKKSLISYFLMAAAFIMVAFFNLGIFPVIIGCALAGLLSSSLHARRAHS